MTATLIENLEAVARERGWHVGLASDSPAYPAQYEVWRLDLPGVTVKVSYDDHLTADLFVCGTWRGRFDNLAALDEETLSCPELIGPRCRVAMCNRPSPRAGALCPRHEHGPTDGPTVWEEEEAEVRFVFGPPAEAPGAEWPTLCRYCGARIFTGNHYAACGDCFRPGMDRVVEVR